MIIKLDVEQTQMDAFARLVDAALKGAGITLLDDASLWVGLLREAAKPDETVEPTPPDEVRD